MVWQVSIVNNSGSPVCGPAASTVIGTSALIFTKFGTILLQDIGHQAGGPHYWAVQISSGGFSQWWWYDGQGVCTLTINDNGTFSVSGQDQRFSAPINGPIGCIFNIPASKRIYITGVTNAAWQQRVTLTLNGMGPSMVWTGAGENNTELVNTYIDTVADPTGWVQAAVLMEHQQPGQNWTPSNMSPVGTYQLMGYNFRMVVSEDGADRDYNDSGLSLQWWELL